MATINPNQDYDIIHTLTYASSGGTDIIRLYRGSQTTRADTVYYRAGTSGAWTSLSVSGYSTTFPITSTTMQIAHNWNKSGNNYMTPAFMGGTMTGIAISQKAVLSGIVGDYFMFWYAYGCANLTTLDIPDTSGLTSVGSSFMRSYAENCSNLTTLAVPDTSGLTSVGDNFIYSYAEGCANLTTLDIPDTSGLTSVGDRFMGSYARDCSSLTTLDIPDTSGLTSVGNSFMHGYAEGCSNLTTLAVPDTSGLTSVGSSFMSWYAWGCSSLARLTLPRAGWFKTHNVNWLVPASRLGLLRGKTSNPTDTTDWQALTVSDKTLHTNYIRDSSLVGENPFLTTTLNSPANNVQLTTTTPTLAFTATDPEGDQVSYQVQVGNADFSTLHMDVTTATFPSGTQQTRVVSPALTQGGIDYYWRVRAKDPSGSDTYGAWSDVRKMTTEALPPSVTSGATTAIATTTATAAGNVTSANGATVTERGIAYHTSTNPTTANSKQVVSGTTGSFTGTLTGLTPNTTYYWRAYATNSKGTTYGVNRSFATEPRPPVVATGTPSGTTINSITVTGSSLTSNPDAQTIDEYGVVYSTSQNPTVSNSKQTASGGSGSYNNTLTGLTENTTYYIRAYVKWRGSDHVYGSQVSFKTQGRPTVTLNTPSASGSVTDVRPHLEFTGNDPDNNQITYQLQLNTSNSFTSPSLDVLSASDTGFTNRSDVKTDPFYSGNQIRYTLQADLARGSDYYWRVRGRDTNGSDTWGNWTTARKFTVSAIPATVTTTGFADILDTSLKVNGTITDNGGATVTERGVVLSTSPNPTTSDLKFTATGDNFTAQATGLTASTTYYVRTYAINSAGTSYSTESTIMTLQPLAPPSLTVGDPTRLIDVSAQITGTVTLDGRRDVTERGIVFSTETNPDTDDNKVTATSAGLGEYTLPLTGLLPETTYYYRAYAINDQGTGYSAEKSFTTLPSFVPDEGDGYWVFSVSDSDAIVSRSQATPAHSSVSLPLADLNLEDGKTYTLAVGDFISELGDPKVTLLSYGYTDPTPILTESGEYLLTETDENILLEQPDPINSIDIPENSQLTFTYNLTNYHSYTLQLHVTGDDPVIEELTATFKDLYLAEEESFSEFVPFTPYGLFEIKLENNQIIDKRRQDVIQSMFSRLEGWEVTPFEVTTEGLGYFEIGDGITIKDPQDNDVKSYITEYTLTLDGGITEKLIGKRPPESETDYSKAGNIKKLISNTTLQVDKQRQEIEALVQDVYDNDGYIEEKFSQVFQDINQVRTTVQGAGGVNLIRNSVMYAYNNLGYPENWTTTHVDGEGSTIVIQGSAESKAAGGLSGHTFTLNGTQVTQEVTVRKDADFITEENKTYYTFNIKVKKNLVGVAYIKLSNRQEVYNLPLPNGEEYLWEDFKIEGLLPQDDHYVIELYSDQDAEAQFTDAMLSVGEYTHAWTQAPGEAMSTVKSDTVDGTYWRSPEFKYNYAHISPLGLNVHKRIRGQQEEVFGFNADETHMSKIKADKQMSMGQVRVVPIQMNGTTGWAWTGTEE